MTRTFKKNSVPLSGIFFKYSVNLDPRQDSKLEKAGVEELRIIDKAFV